MPRYAIDAPTALRLLRDDVAVPEGIRLVAPNLLRSDAMALLYGEVRAGTLSEREGRALLERLASQPVRLLGDRASRSVAWRIATELGWHDTARAEYVAVAQLQADAFVTADPALAAAVAGIVALAPYEVLL